ncbi:glutamate carboxypeptidase [Sporomusaceae bacterium BoRhaA]|uniref:M20/M25/M40 family metallo-hydrolase n=1 Tax=Pelorhabdus rhamnosifermentans TaxID=2772457 RepID=UPI001C063D3D|nr:M20/M25/M40 family metallo-hydrolase [Pelorhabdus rhamnosifermentans]MBU2704159.1 glutamate carboxypeptidase [Pelorhabdus rhamnosifermentans]
MEVEQLQTLIEKDFPTYIKDLEYITNIDSGSRDKDGTHKIAEYLAEKLKASGAHTEFVTNEDSTHLIARFQGKGKVKILMLAHIDTVFDTGEVSRRPFHMDQNKKAYGPGVGDDKATVIQTVYVMKILHELDFHDYGEVIIYYNGQEEIGSDDAEKIITKLAQEVDFCIVMDTARPKWGIVTQRKGRSSYRVDVTGKAGHAGNSSQNGASATVELAHQILNIYSLTRGPLVDGNLAQRAIAPDITANIGIIGTKNTKVNVIPADAFAEIEIRAFSLSDLKRLDKQIHDFAQCKIVSDAKVVIKGSIQNVPLEKTKQISVLVDIYRTLVKQTYQADVWEEAAGGVTDGNVAALYVPTLDALGIENYDEHTDHEWVDLNTVGPRTAALLLLIQEVCQKWPLW